MVVLRQKYSSVRWFWLDNFPNARAPHTNCHLWDCLNRITTKVLPHTQPTDTSTATSMLHLFGHSKTARTFRKTEDKQTPRNWLAYPFVRQRARACKLGKISFISRTRASRKSKITILKPNHQYNELNVYKVKIHITRSDKQTSKNKI